MSSPLIPWLPSNIPIEIQVELDRRKVARGLNYVPNAHGEWDSTSGDWKNYKGPMMAWVRACSNGLGHPSEVTENKKYREQKFPRAGFVLFGNEDFYTTYGFGGAQTLSGAGGQTVLGFTPDGYPHNIDYDVNTSNYPIHVPTPEISKIDVNIQKEIYRRANIYWTCFSYKQLEYMTPYFLTPGISVILEWGWNHFNPKSLLDLTDITGLQKLWGNPYPLYSNNILDSNGNYDAVWGIITNFNFSVEGNVIKAVTEITSKDRIYAGVSISNTVLERSEDEKQVKSVADEKLPKLFSTLNSICEGNFVNNLKTISETKTSVDKIVLTSSDGSLDLKALCKKLTRDGKESYWRGIFYGRPETHRLRNGFRNNKDFDAQLDQVDNIWINMGMVVELLNFCLPLPDIGSENLNFFRVDIDDCIIGGHPNLISTSDDVLIPNSKAPKFNFNVGGPQDASDVDVWTDQKWSYKGNTLDPQREDTGDLMYAADYQLSKIFKHGFNARRDNLDMIINSNIYDKLGKSERSHAFPFDSPVEILPATSNHPAVIGKQYFNGYLKDIYIRLSKIIDIIKTDTTQLTYPEIYTKIFEVLQNAVRGYWNFSLVDSTGKRGLVGPASMKIVDTLMAPIKNGDNPPYHFTYGGADSIIQSLSFKPQLSDAQASRVLFADKNNPDSLTVLSPDSRDLLNYQFKDRILISREFKENSGSSPSSTEDQKKMLDVKRIALQKLENPMSDCLPMRISYTIDKKRPYHYINLVLPYPEFLSLLLDDGDEDNNNRYYGIQPNITAELTMMGVGGLRTFQMFFIDNLPRPYSPDNIVFRIIDVQQTIENGRWETILRAGILPLKKSIKDALNVNDVSGGAH